MSNNEKQKRAAKRYPYFCEGRCAWSTQVVDVQLVNISTSGIQFSARTPIESKNPIRIAWMDPQFGNFDATFLIARKINHPEDDKNHYYGCQYFNLSEDVKNNLRTLIRNFKEHSKKALQQQAEKITPEYMLEVIAQGSNFLKEVLHGDGVPNPFEDILKNIKDYEKESFVANDEVSLCLQKLTTSNFHCNLFGMMTPLMVSKDFLHPVFFRYIQDELDRISAVESETEELVKKIVEGQQKREGKKSIQVMLNESNNRLFYNKQAFLQSFIETFHIDDCHIRELKTNLENIKNEYERILKLTNTSFQEANYVNLRRSQKPEEYSKSDTIADVQRPKKSKPHFLIWLGLFIVLVYAMVAGFGKVLHKEEKNKFVNQINLPIQIINSRQSGVQLILTFSSDEWKKLSVENKRNIYIKIIQFLKNEKELQTCIIFDDHHQAIRMLQEDMSTTMNFRDLSAPSSKTPKSKQPVKNAQ